MVSTFVRAFALLAAMLMPATVLAQASDENAADAMGFAVNNSIMILYHEIGHLFVGELGLPVLGKNEDAADSLSAVFLLGEAEDWTDEVLRDAADGWYMSPFNGKDAPGDWAFMGQHSLDKQRSFFFVCMMVGNNPEYYGELATDYGMDAAKQEHCGYEYKQAADSWEQLLAPHALDEGTESTGQINIVYADPGEYAAYAEALQADQFLEYAAETVTGNFNIPRDLTFQAVQCGVSNAYYNPGEAAVTFCYEYVKHLSDLYLESLAAGGDEEDEGEGTE